jgi:hypothetical protein
MLVIVENTLGKQLQPMEDSVVRQQKISIKRLFMEIHPKDGLVANLLVAAEKDRWAFTLNKMIAILPMR